MYRFAYHPNRPVFYGSWFAYHPNRAVFSGHWLFAKLTKSRWTRVEFAYHPDIPVFSGSWLFSTFEEWPEDRLDLPLNNSRYLGVWASTESEDFYFFTSLFSSFLISSFFGCQFFILQKFPINKGTFEVYKFLRLKGDFQVCFSKLFPNSDLWSNKGIHSR